MIGLLATSVGGAAVSLTLGVAFRGGRWRIAAIVETVMLAAMLDVHLPMLGLLPAPLWALLLMACAVGAAFADRLRRGDPGHPAGDHLHAFGMLLAAVLLLVVGASGHGPADAPSAHLHGSPAPGAVLGVTALAVVAYSSGVVGSLLRRRPGRAETARRFASLVGLLAMAAMAIIPAVD